MFRDANRRNVAQVAVVGEAEVQHRILRIKDMAENRETELGWEEVPGFLLDKKKRSSFS